MNRESIVCASVVGLVNARPDGFRARDRPRVGILGAGQLARMDVEAATALDLDVRVLAESEDDAAVLAGAEAMIGDLSDLDTLRAFAAGVDVVTLELEGVPADHLHALADDGVVLCPAPAALRFAQDKLHQRRQLGGAGFPVPAFAHARTAVDVAEFAAVHGWPVVMKAPQGGYDGRGVEIATDETAAAAFLASLPDGALLEPALAIEAELAVQVARTARGETVVYPVVETVQRDAMLAELVCPARVETELAVAATELARGIVSHIGATGLVAVELFHTPEGLLVNELALRPHNSGHHTIEATVCSQFEQHLRAALDWPLGSTELVAPAAVCVNVVGPPDGSDPRARLAQALAVSGAHVHLYGKSPRPGRKLGHVTALGPDLNVARDTAWRAARTLEGSTTA